MTIKQLINIAALCHFRHITTQKKCSASGGKAPWALTRALDPLGAQPPDPHYRLVLCARHMDLYDPQSLLLDSPLLLLGWEGGYQSQCPTLLAPRFECLRRFDPRASPRGSMILELATGLISSPHDLALWPITSRSNVIIKSFRTRMQTLTMAHRPDRLLYNYQ